MANDVTINIKAKDQTGPTFSKFSSTLLGINQALQLVRAAADMAKKAFDWTREGAQFAQTEKSFNRLTESVGMGTDTLDEWSKAASGTIDNATLMSGFLTLTAGTSKELTAAFAENNDKLLQIAKAANALNPALGDTAFMYDSIAKGIKRASPMILDNLGIVVKVGEANEALAESLGKTVDELTAEEKQMAILNEVLKSGDTLVQQLGGSVESMVDPWDRLTTAIKNMNNELQASMTQTSGFAGLLNSITDGLDEGQVQLEIYNSKVEILDSALKAGIITEKEHAKALVELSNKYQILETDVGYYNDMVEIAKSHTQGMSDEVLQAEFALGLAAEAMGNATTATEGLDEAVGNLNDEMTTLDGIFGEAKDALGEMGVNMDEESALMRDMALAAGETTRQNEQFKDAIWNLSGALADGQVTSGEYIGTLLALQQAAEDGSVSISEMGDALRGLPREVRSRIYVDYIISQTGKPPVGGPTTNIPELEDIDTPVGGPWAAGGPVHPFPAAAGAGAYWVGEVGPELFIPEQNGRILSNSDSMSAFQGSSGMGGQPVQVNVNITTAVNMADKAWAERELAPYINKAIREAAR